MACLMGCLASIMDWLLVFRTHVVVYLGDSLGYESVERHTSMIVTLLTVTHFCSFLILLYEPLFAVCIGYYGAFSIVESVTLFGSTLFLLSIFLCYIIDSVEWVTVIRVIHLFHFPALMWVPALVPQWFVCIGAIELPNIFKKGSSIILEYGPLTLNRCFNTPPNCFATYSLKQIEILLMSTILGAVYSIYIFVIREMEYRSVRRYLRETMAIEAPVKNGYFRRYNFPPSDSSSQVNSDSEDAGRGLSISSSSNNSQDNGGMQLYKRVERAVVHDQPIEFELQTPKSDRSTVRNPSLASQKTY